MDASNIRNVEIKHVYNETKNAGQEHSGIKTESSICEDRFISSDMSIMIEDIMRADETLKSKSSQAESSENAGLLEKTSENSSALHKKGKEHLKSHALLGAHFGLEGMETGGLIIQTAQHSITAAVKEAKSNLSQTASSTAGHEAKTDLSAATGHAAEHSAKADLSGVANQAAEHSAKVDVSELSAHAAAAGGTVSATLIAGAVGAGVISGAMLILGVGNIKNGVKQNNKEKILDGSGECIVGLKSGAMALSIAGHGAGEGLISAVGHYAQVALAPLGIIHGTIDLALGAKKIKEGIEKKDKHIVFEGILEGGQGVAIAAAGVCGGLPAIVAASSFLLVRMAHHYIRGNHH